MKNIKYIQIIKGFIALIITVALLYTGQALWRSYAIDLPLDKTLNEIDGVEEVSWDAGSSFNDAVIINIKLGNIDNLQKTYKEIKEKIDLTLNGKKYSLEIADDRSQELEQAYYDIHYYVQKSIIDGDFPSLEAEVREKAEMIGAEAKVYVDEQNIYLQFTKKDNSLFAAIGRHFDRTGGNL